MLWKNNNRSCRLMSVHSIQSLQQFLCDPSSDSKRLSDLQKQFAAIWHANKCLKVKSSDCTLPICPEWRSIINHYSNCTSGYECAFQSCGSSRVLIDHYNSCSKNDCCFCSPLRKCSTTKKTSTIVCAEIENCITTAGPSSTSEFAASVSRGFFSGGGDQGWSETACTARQAYFSTYGQDFYGEHRSSYRVLTSTVYNRSPYGKRERIQRELIVMFHVQKCAELDDIDPSKQHLCTVPHCPKMKRTLIHVSMCAGEGCNFPECNVTRTIIQHWLRCPKSLCDVCSPVLRTIPALDGGMHCDMDEKLLSLLYTSTNGLSDINSSDLSPYEVGWSELCFGEEEGSSSSKSAITIKRKVSTISSPPSQDLDLDKKRRTD